MDIGEVQIAAFLGMRTRDVFGEKELIEPPVVILVRERPSQACRSGSLQITMNARLSDRTTAGDLVLAQPETESQTEHFLDLTRRQPPCRQI
jgi:hypothetical protein